MKINKKSGDVLFGTLFQGDVFVHGDLVYIRTDDAIGGDSSAVCLEDGELVSFMENIKVIPLPNANLNLT